MLQCPCAMANVGQTTRTVKIRINESNIRLYTTKLTGEQQIQDMCGKRRFGETTVAKHFHECYHNVSDLKWLILEQIFDEDKYNVGRTLLQHETYWIDKLKTIALHGMNEICNFNVFL